MSTNRGNNKIIQVIKPPIKYATIVENKLAKAIHGKKIFYINGGNCTLRILLKRRGWIEKLPLKYLNKNSQFTTQQLYKKAKPGNKYESLIFGKSIKNLTPNFIWQSQGCSKFKIPSKIFPYCNRIDRSKYCNFTTKGGLISCIESSHWNTIDGLAEIHVPRFHHLSNLDDWKEFLTNYRTTYCLSLIKYIFENRMQNDKIFNKDGIYPINILNFAFRRIASEIEYRGLNNFKSLSEFRLLDDRNLSLNSAWEQYYKVADSLISGKAKLRAMTDQEIQFFLRKCEKCLEQAEKYWPTLSSDGYNNLWILKPSNSCRGHGIVIMKNFKEIIQYVTLKVTGHYIVQKYIERPLLIFKTKFDIRQYTLFTLINNRFNIWMYKDCYLRFSSQEYNLSKLDKSVHITNNAVQRKFKNGPRRSKKLPSHNMWSLNSFLYYLNQNYKNENYWYKKIYPGMKKNIIAIALTSLDGTELIANRFEIFGCDFMLDDNFEPMLIEINASPDLSHTTSVTAKICPNTLNDLLKVILDRPKNPAANTGKFELIYSVHYSEIHSLNSSNNSMKDIEVIGKKLDLTNQTRILRSPFKNNKPIKSADVVCVKKRLCRKMRNKRYVQAKGHGKLKC